MVRRPGPGRAQRFADRHGGPGGPAAQVVSSAGEVAAASEIILLATWNRAPLLRLADLRPGQHVTSLGVDEPGKAKLGPDVLRAAAAWIAYQTATAHGRGLAVDLLA